MDLKQLQEEWTDRIDGNGIRQAVIWDGRAEEFEKKPIPDRKEDPFLQYLWKKAEPREDMQILDIGCGAGQYALALSPWVKRVVGTDVSAGMIRAAKKRAKMLGADNAQFLAADWSETEIDRVSWRESFDIVFAHMTPAICDYHTLDLMNACTKKHCFLVKPARRSDLLLDGAFGEIGLTEQREKADTTVLNAFTCLWLKGYTPEVTVRDEVWNLERSATDMIRWCIDRAGTYRELNFWEKEKIGRYILDREENGKVIERVSTAIVTIYWHI